MAQAKNEFGEFAYSSGSSTVPTEPRRKKRYRQAKERSDGSVEVLCFSCRRSRSKKFQPSLSVFLAPEKAVCKWSCSRCTFDNKLDTSKCLVCNAKRESQSQTQKPTLASGDTFCSRCRKCLSSSKPKHSKPAVHRLPILSRLQGYRRLAAECVVPFTLPDHVCIQMMHEPCIVCGEEPTEDGHGLTRLRFWPPDLAEKKKQAKKGFMGPFCPENVRTACKYCNLMKGHRSLKSYVEAARHVATYRGNSIKGGGESFGLYPQRFRNNISKRSRSAYITKSSTHQKTHCLTNQQFAEIVAKPCHYCGKESDPPKHYNGLDRLDSDNRIYAVDTVVSCCGDCNIMKYTHSEEFFLQHCLKIAKFNAGKTVEEDPNENHKDEFGNGTEPS